MSDYSNEHTPKPYALVNISNMACVGNSESSNGAILQNLTSPGSFQVLFGLTGVDPLPPPLNCPVSNCSSVFAGRTPQRYLSRHLKYPGFWGRTGESKVAWLNLHRIEHHRLVVGGAKSTKPKRRAENPPQRISRAAVFKLRAMKMGITDTTLVAEKVAIWEGISGDKEKGDSIGHDAWILLDAFTNF